LLKGGWEGFSVSRAPSGFVIPAKAGIQKVKTGEKRRKKESVFRSQNPELKSTNLHIWCPPGGLVV
jgi:hypothetical protein